MLAELANKLKPGSVKAAKGNMAFKLMENIEQFTKFARAFGVDDRNNFMTVDLWENKNLKAVCTCVREIKRLSGKGFVKAAAGNASPAAPSAVSQFASKDDSATGDVLLNEAPITIKTEDAVARTGAAQLAGHGRLDAHTGVDLCRVCNRAITGAVIKGCGFSYHANCFTCKKCGTKLAEAKFYEHEDKPYCDKCILVVKPQTTVRAKVKDSSLFANK